jgi:hypothetical protein
MALLCGEAGVGRIKRQAKTTRRVARAHKGTLVWTFAASKRKTLIGQAGCPFGIVEVSAQDYPY